MMMMKMMMMDSSSGVRLGPGLVNEEDGALEASGLVWRLRCERWRR